jgi:hypothetical protein
MRGIGTYFDQVPKTVIEKMLARQESLAESEPGSDEAVKKWAPSKTKTRSSKP